MKIMSVVGARPNFMKIAPFVGAIQKANEGSKTGDREFIEHYLVHTGQHYDDKMSESFFDELNIPKPDIDLGVGSGTHGEQVGRTIIEFEKVVVKEKPDWVVVVGDVNATCACSITAKKENIKLAHIESGLRSFDLKMPEEINRMVTDRLADLHFTTDHIADQNLLSEGVPEERIKRVGNIMIDTLMANRDKADVLDMTQILKKNSLMKNSLIKVDKDQFALMTLHRPANVDYKEILAPIVEFLLSNFSQDMPLIWPIHPRARKQLTAFGLWDMVIDSKGLILTEPLGYHELLKLNMNAKVMLTDSGGLQEECCIVGTPCITLRWNTERPITLEENGGVSVIVGNDTKRIACEYNRMKALSRRSYAPELWDGHTAERIVEVFRNQL